MARNGFRRDAEPAGLVHENIVRCIAREEFVALVEVWATVSAERQMAGEMIGDSHF